MNEPKIDLPKIYTFKILESLKIEFGADEYDSTTRLLREFKEAIEKEFTARDKRSPDISKDNPNIRLTERPQTLEGVTRERPAPTILGQTNENIFDNPEKIETL